MKTPKIGFAVSPSKEPRINADPANYKNQKVSWQLHTIDPGAPWGIDYIKNHQYIKLGERTLNELPAGIHNDLYDAIGRLDKEKFDSIDSFLKRLYIECNGNISAEEQRIILNTLSENIFWAEVFPKLSHFEMSDWNTIEREGYGSHGKTKHHSISVSDIVPKAQKRLAELKLDDIDSLFSIRLSGKFRIWGIRKFGYLQVLWFDPNHEVCPSSHN